MKENEIVSVGAYFRISIEDTEKKKDESNSITNQRNLIHQFLKKQSELVLVKEYVDDGYSGVSFERPGFLEMMEDVKSGKINCIIVKDLSRFGRNYIEAGKYIERIFPSLGIRFIAVTDHIDSSSTKYQDEMIIPFKNFINDAYSRDISVKVRSELDIKRMRGEFIGSFAPYGYLKNKENKNILSKDTYAAEIIKSIFQWKLEGESQSHIANRLNEQGILNPTEYKRFLGYHAFSGFQKKINTKWYPGTVTNILKNEVYLGHMIQGKKESPNHKIRKYQKKDDEKWFRVENTHEPLISQSEFDKVQRLLKLDTRISPEEEKLYLFSGFLYCADCKKAMIRQICRSKGKKYVYYICNTHKKDKNVCSSHRISEQMLKNCILDGIKIYLKVFLKKQFFEEEKKRYQDFFPLKCQGQNEIFIFHLKEKQKKLENLKDGLKEDLQKRVLVKREYMQLKRYYNNQIKEIEKQINAVRLYEEKDKNIKEEKEERTQRELENKIIMELTRILLFEMVDNIWVYNRDKIKINFLFYSELN